MFTLTPIEDQMLNAQELAAGLAATAMIQNLIREGEEARIGVFDRTLPDEVRAEAMKDSRRVNDTLKLITTMQEISGISA